MYKNLTILLLIIFSITSYSDENNVEHNIDQPFKNSLEGKSVHFHRRTFFGKWNFKRRIKKFSRELNKEKIEKLSTKLKRVDYLCEENLINSLNSMMGLKDYQYVRRTYYLYILRKHNIIDDLSLGNYLRFSKIFPSLNLKSFNPKRFTKEKDKPLKLFSLKIKTKQCFIENATSFLGNFKFKKKNLKKYLKNSPLSKEERKIFLHSLKKEVHKTQITNKNYDEKLRTIRSKILSENKISFQRSNIISRYVKEIGTSPRVSLLKKYNAFQIVIMNKVISQFQKRVENASWLNIQIYDSSDNILEELKIEGPTEVYRFCIKLFRKEMSEVKINRLFNNMTPSFNDFLAASYELGTINNEFLEELYKIEELWNPKKTKWEKVKVWASITSQVASVFTPPPYNYLISFGLIAIEYYNRNPESASYEHSIFGSIK